MQRQLVDPNLGIKIMENIRAEDPENALKAEVVKLGIKVLKLLPKELIEEVEDPITCERCWYRSKDTHMCLHSNGLSGRLQPSWYCVFATPAPPDEDEPVEDTFDTFDIFAEG